MAERKGKCQVRCGPVTLTAKQSKPPNSLGVPGEGDLGQPVVDDPRAAAGAHSTREYPPSLRYGG